MNSPNINFAKVQAAVEKYVPKAVQPKSPEKKIPVDAALRKPLRGPSRSCSGFHHSHFLNNEPQ